MIDFQQIILPVALGIFGGLVAPVLVEKWKGSKKKEEKQLLIETDVEKLQETVDNLSKKVEEKIAAIENELKEMELRLSHTLGILKSHFSEVSLEGPVSSPEGKRFRGLK